jgi:adenosylcobinamide-GDP ribazoletransferase
MNTALPATAGVLRRELRLAAAALQYFTRVPVPAWAGADRAQLNACLRWFPAVGLFVGGVSAAGFALGDVVAGPLFGAVLALAAGVWLTGALHEDGLADTCDGLGGGATREQALAIMKDPRAGSYAVLALALVLLGKAALLGALGATAVAALVAAHGVSRWMAASIVYRGRYVRDAASARAKPALGGLSGRGLAFAALTVLPALAWLGSASAGGVAAALAMRLWLGRLFARRLGGYTGDCLGATQQMSEVAFYFGVALFVRVAQQFA